VVVSGNTQFLPVHFYSADNGFRFSVFFIKLLQVYLISFPYRIGRYIAHVTFLIQWDMLWWMETATKKSAHRPYGAAGKLSRHHI